MSRKMILWGVCMLPCTALADEPPAKSKLDQLSFLVGDWQGAGSVEMNGKRAEFRGVESVRFGLDENVLVIQGKHEAKDGTSGSLRPVHEALGVIHYDRRTEKITMHAFTARGDSTVADVRVTDQRMQWSFEAGPMQFRYSMKLSS